MLFSVEYVKASHGLPGEQRDCTIPLQSSQQKVPLCGTPCLQLVDNLQMQRAPDLEWKGGAVRWMPRMVPH